MAPYDHVKLDSLARTHRLALLPRSDKLSSLTELDVPNYVTPVSAQRAEQCLLESKSSKLVRKPTLLRTKDKLKLHEIKTITAALPQLVDANEHVGVIQALLNRQLQSSSPSQHADHDPLLLKAVDASNVDLLWLFAPRASLPGRNQALALALFKRSSASITKLLEYGADPNSCSQQFLAAAASEDAFTVEHLLSAPTDLSQTILRDALLPAVQTRSCSILQHIVRATDLYGVQDIPAIGEAVNTGQVDAVLTLLLSASCVRSDYLDELVLNVFNNGAIDPASLTTILHALFYAGASGPKSSAAMRIAVEKRSLDFVRLFAGHRVDINWGRGGIVKSAVETGRGDLLREVLRSNSLSIENASAAVKALPQTLPAPARYDLLETLINAGAHGDPIENELILAVRNNDTSLVTLLRRNGVSIDSKQGDALIAAIQGENIQLLGQLLNGPVLQVSLQTALPHVRFTTKASRLALTRLLIQAKVEGEAVDKALRDAVCDETSSRDRDLIVVLIHAGANPVYDDARCLRYAIQHQDPELFEGLLASPVRVSQGVVSSLVPDILNVKDRAVRLGMMRCVLMTRPKELSVASALLDVVLENVVDIPLLEMIARSGQADINYHEGVVLERGMLAAMDVLEELLRMPSRSQPTTTAALIKLLGTKLYNDSEKANRAALLLSLGRTSRAATQGLLSYIEFWNSCEVQGKEWPIETFEILLNAGADINASVSILSDTTRAAATSLLEIFLVRKPDTAFLDSALLEAIKLDSSGRTDAVRLILEAAPSNEGISLALVHASCAKLDDTCSMLLGYGPSLQFDSFAAIRHATISGSKNLLNIFLTSKPPQEVVEAAFRKAKVITNVEQRFQVLQAILKVGVRNELLSRYLIDQVEYGSRHDLIQLLLNHKADVHYQQNRCLVLASLQGVHETLRILLAKVTSEPPSAATQCFEECVKNSKVRESHVLSLALLLDAGATGDSLNVALRQAVDQLPSQPGLLDLVRALLSHGADVNDSEGYALCRACETTGSEVITVLMQGAPSVMVRSRAIHSLLRSSVPEAEFCRNLERLITMQTPSREVPSLSLLQEGFEDPLKVLLVRRSDGVVELTHVLKHHPQILSQPVHNAIFSWALAQESARIHDECLALLITHGANVNYRDVQTGESILLQTIRCRRSGLVKLLAAYGADVAVTDHNGTSPLLLASMLGDQIAATTLLEMGAPKNDGSLHHAVCGLQSEAVKILLQNHHDPNYPSPYYQGRTALAELLYTGEANAQNHGLVQKVIGILQDYGANTERHVSRKPLICWALDNPRNPVWMARALLSAYLYKDIDADFNLYNNGMLVFSPTMYVTKREFTGPKERADELVGLLRDFGANRDVYYSTMGPQPEDVQGMPKDLADIEMVRRAKVAMRREEEEDLTRRRRMEDEERRRRRDMDDEEYQRKKQREEEEFQRQVGYRRRLEAEEREFLKEKNMLAIRLNAEAENAKRLEMYEGHLLQLDYTRKVADSERKVVEDRSRVQKQERVDELGHRTALGQLDLKNTKERLLLESDSQRTTAGAAQAALEAQVKVQKSLMASQDQHHERLHTRRMKQLAMEKAMPVGWSPSGGGFIENGSGSTT